MPILFDQGSDSEEEHELTTRTPQLRSRSNTGTRTLRPSLNPRVAGTTSSDVNPATTTGDGGDDGAEEDEEEDLNGDDVEATWGLLRTSKRSGRASSKGWGFRILTGIVAVKNSLWPVVKLRMRALSWSSCGMKRYHGLRLRLYQLFLAGVVLTTIWVFYVLFLAPSYAKSRYPENYRVIEESVRKGGGVNAPGYWKNRPADKKKRALGGRGNPNGEKVFVAANIINAELISGRWGDAVIELMDLLGEENVFLSIFENDSGPATTAALTSFATLISKNLPSVHHSILSTTLPLSNVPRITTPNGESYVKRIAYLAEVRNRAILPLVGSIPSLPRWNQTGHTFPRDAAVEEEKPAMPADWVNNPIAYTKVLFLNDVIFDPLEAVHLLFSTNEGKFAAACGMDFVNPFKYYDTFATRDASGSSLGVPFFPFFTPSTSRKEILHGEDHVPVKSCWGGIAAFDAAYFVSGFPSSSSKFDDDDDDLDDESDSDKRAAPTPLRFRSEEDPYWDASECCLIHADIDTPKKTFINPFIRVAYDASTFSWLPAVRRIERLFAPAHRALAWTLGMPWGGLRKREKEGDVVNDRAWDGRKWVERTRVAGKGGFCGSSMLLVMTEKEDEVEKGKRGWRRLEVPKGG